MSSLFISFSLSVEDSLHLFCPVLSYYLYLIFVSAFFLCYETALLTRQRSQCFATNEFLFLFRPRSVLCSVLTCSHSTQCCVLLWWDELSVYHKMCVILSHVVKCWDARWFQDGLKTKTTLKELVLLRPGLSSLMWVYYVCVHGCMYVCVISVFLLKLSFRKAPSPWLVCTDVSGLFATLILSKYHTSEGCLSLKKKRQALQRKMQKQKMFSPVQNSPGSADWEVWQNISGHAAKFISISSSQSCIFTCV